MTSPKFCGLVTAAVLLVAASIPGAAAQDKPQDKAQDKPDVIWPTKGWQTSAPEEQGMDSAALAKLVEYGTSRSFDSVLIARHGKIVLDAYWAPYSADIPHIINSSTKAVIGTLAAMAMKDGLIDSPEHKVVDLFSDRTIANLDERKKAMTLQHLLDMTSGLEWREPFGGRLVSFIEMERSPDWIKYILDQPMANAPGEMFNYDSGNPHLLSAILTRLTGLSAEDYAKARLFGPLGITEWKWRRDPQGNSTGGNGLALKPRDMAKIGYLYLRSGQWEDKALIPPTWVDRASHATIDMHTKFEPALRYSNFFWALPEKNVYMAVGYNNQIIMIFPALDIVAVTTTRSFYPLALVADYISGAVKSENALALSPEGTSLLADAVRQVSTERPIEVVAMPEMATAISGKRYTFPGNRLWLKSLKLTLAGDEQRVDIEFFDRDPTKPSRLIGGPLGLDGVYRRGDMSPGGPSAAKGNWKDDHTFVLNRMILGAGYPEQTYTLSFDDAKLKVSSRDFNNREVTAEGEAFGN